jgi:Polyketide cyclase / dehydrase and lipid transport
MRWLDAVLPVAHTAERSVAVSAPPERVWSALTDVGAFPEWRPDVARVDQLPDRTWREHGKHGVITYHVTAAEPPSRLVVRIADTSLPFGGEWEYRVGPGQVTIIERGEIYNLFFRVMSRFVFGYTRTIEAYLWALKQRVESRPS